MRIDNYRSIGQGCFDAMLALEGSFAATPFSKRDRQLFLLVKLRASQVEPARTFSAGEVMALTWQIVTANGWNRLCRGPQVEPESLVARRTEPAVAS